MAIISKRFFFLIVAFVLLSFGAQAAIDHELDGVANESLVEGILQITPGNPALPEENALDWVPCWGVNPWSYDGQWIVYHSQIGSGTGSNKNEICIIRADGTNWQRLTNNESCDTHGNFTPDGTKIVFQREPEDDAQIWIMNVDGSNQQNLTLVHGGPMIADGCEMKPMISPDGTKIAFRACDGNEGIEEIWVMNIDGTNPLKISGNIENCSKHSWSPDSQWVLFSADANDDDHSKIYKVRRDGSGLVMLSEEEGDFCENWAAWSPDGQWISYHRRNWGTDDTSDLWIMRSDGTQKQILVDGLPDGMDEEDEWVCGPHSWHPGSRWIVFKKWLEDSPIFLIDIQTKQVSQLTEGYRDGRMWWSPDGRNILFQEYRYSGDQTRDEGAYNSDLLVLQLNETFAFANQGDINQDGTVNIQDLLLCLRMSLGMPVTIGENVYQPPYMGLVMLADMNGSGGVNIMDVIMLLRQILSVWTPVM